MRRFRSLKVTKVTGKIGATFSPLPGVLSLTTELGLEADRQVDVSASAKNGSSACNIGSDIQILDSILQECMKVESQDVFLIRQVLEDVGLYASVLQPHEVKELEFHLRGLSDQVVLVLSVLMSVSKVLGRESAVEVTSSFIEKVVKVNQGALPLDKVWMNALLRTLIQDVFAGGPSWVSDKAKAYDIDVNTGAQEVSWDSMRFKEVTFGMVTSLIWWLYQGTVKVDNGDQGQAGIQMCKTYDNRLHKVVYLLEQFKWPVHAAMNDVDDGSALNPRPRRVMIQAHKCMRKEFEEILMLSPEDVEKHGQRVPRRGSTMVCKYGEVGKVLRAQIGGEAGRLLESAWETAWDLAMSCEVVITCQVSDQSNGEVVLLSLGEKNFPREESGKTRGCEIALTSYVGRGYASKLANMDYAPHFHKLYGGTRREYEYQLTYLQGSPALHNQEFVNHFQADGGETQRNLRIAMLGFVLGYLCGSVFNLAKKMNLFLNKEDVSLSWLDDLDQFRQDLSESMGDTRVFTSNIGGCLDLIAACFYGEAERLNSVTRTKAADTCVGTWAGEKILLLDAVVNPAPNYDGPNCSVQELDSLPINIPCRDGKSITGANISFNSSRIQGEVISRRVQSEHFVKARKPDSEVSFTIGPNLIDNDGSVMHCMYAKNKLIHCSSVLEAIPVTRTMQIDSTSCSHTESEKIVYKATKGRLAYPVLDKDLIDQGVLIPPFKTSQGYPAQKYSTAVAVVQADGNEMWRFTAASMYRELNAVIARGCLACLAGDALAYVDVIIL